jgi:hypothetical protein
MTSCDTVVTGAFVLTSKLGDAMVRGPVLQGRTWISKKAASL